MTETRRMPPAVVRSLWIAGALVAMLVLAALLLPYVVSLDAMRARVVSAAESALKRKVEIGKMRLQILSGPGAAIEKVAVRNGPGWESPALLTADRASVKVAFWPLLARRVEVRRIVLEGVTLSVERNPDGKLNVSDFLSASTRESPPASQTAATALLVSRVEIERGRLVFVDRKVSPGTSVTVALDDVTGRITDVSPSRPARFSLAARFLADSGRNLTLEGTVGPPPPAGQPVGGTPLKARFGAKAVKLGGLGPYVEAFRGPDPGTMTIEGTVDGSMMTSRIAGQIGLDPSGSGSAVPSLDGAFSIDLDWPKGTLVVQRSLLEVAGLPLAFEGRLDDLQKTPRVDLRVSTPGDVPIDDVTGVPGLAGRLPENVRLAGRLRMEARIQGAAGDLESTASVDAAPFQVAMDGRPYFAAPSARATLAGRGAGPLSGRITVPSGTLKSLPFEAFAADWSWNAGALTLSPSARVFGGSLSAGVETDVSKPESESRASVELAAVPAARLIESLTSRRDVLTGALSGSISLSSRGLGWDAIRTTASGEGRVAVADADLRTVKLMPEVARALGAVGQAAGFAVPPALESTRFTALRTSLRLAGGRLETPDLTLAGRDVAVAAAGSLGLDGTLSYRGRIVLGRGIVASLGTAGRYLADSQGRLALPFEVSGPVASPKVAIDDSGLLDVGRRVLARQAREKLGGAAGQAVGEVLEGGDGKSDPLDLLRRLLKAPARTPTPAPPR